MRPTPSDLRDLRTRLAPRQIAELFRTTPEQVEGWIRDDAAPAGPAWRGRIDRLLTAAIEKIFVALQTEALDTRDQLAQARLAVAVLTALVPHAQAERPAVELDRASLLEKLRRLQ